MRVRGAFVVWYYLVTKPPLALGYGYGGWGTHSAYVLPRPGVPGLLLSFVLARAHITQASSPDQLQLEDAGDADARRTPRGLRGPLTCTAYAGAVGAESQSCRDEA